MLIYVFKNVIILYLNYAFPGENKIDLDFNPPRKGLFFSSDEYMSYNNVGVPPRSYIARI